MAEQPLADLIVLFGGTGDLAQKMLFPSLYNLDADGFLAEGFGIIATARAEMTREAFVAQIKDAVSARVGGGGLDPKIWARFEQRLQYVGADATTLAGAAELKAALGGAKTPIYYLALSPSIYGRVCAALADAGMAGPGTRIVLEKPIGRDLESSKVINGAVAAVFPEESIFRIDHYLGKETVQNLLALRFANTLFEPLWNNLTIDHVQITVAETEGVGDRWPYYDEYGALRDMVQNHMLQLLCLVAMEPPAAFSADAIRDEKLKVLRALKPIDASNAAQLTVRGQYRAGAANGQSAPGYVEELGQPSDTETFVAIKAEVANWRWAGVPFYLRTGKRMPERLSEIVVTFRSVPHSIFEPSAGPLQSNKLVLRLQPDEGVKFWLMNKVPGPGGMRLRHVAMDMSFAETFNVRHVDAYERLLGDVVRGNPMLFMRRDEVEAGWRWADQILAAWANSHEAPKPYTAGSWGPSAAVALIERDGRTWNDDAG